MLSIGALIWLSLRPLIRLFFCVSGGIILTKADVFPSVAARGAGQILLNITLPCLMFSKIVPVFTLANVNVLGPLVLVAVLYELMGGLMAVVVRYFCWVPHRFRYGILVAGAFANVSDVPTSVIMSVTGAAPFNGVDQSLSVAYISAFILVSMVTLFPFGGHKLVAWDYIGPDVEDDEVQDAMQSKGKAMMRIFRRFRSRSVSRSPDVEECSKQDRPVEEKTIDVAVVEALRRKEISLADDATAVVPTGGASSPVCSPSPTETGVPFSRTNSLEDSATLAEPETNHGSKLSWPVLPTHSTSQGSQSHRWTASRRTFTDFLCSFLTPPTLTISLAFMIALIPKLKALFVGVPGVYMPSTPDGQPPLAFVMDMATFVGAASSPLGLICLGASLARLPFPKNGEWRTWPLGAIGWMAVGKMLLMPVLGVLICEGLTKVGVIPVDDKVLRFVCIFFSCLPTATTQVFLTQAYSETGSAEHISAFLIPQYLIMFVSMTAVTAYSIHLIF